MKIIYTKFKLYIEDNVIKQKEDPNGYLFDKLGKRSSVKKDDLENIFLETESYNNIYYLNINNIIDLKYKSVISSLNKKLELLYISYSEKMVFLGDESLKTVENCDFILCDDDIYKFINLIESNNTYNVSKIKKQIDEVKKQMY